MMTIQKVNIFFKIIFISLIFILISFSGCIDNNINDVDNKGEEYDLVIAFGIDRFNGLYPHINILNDQTFKINSNIYSSLVEFDENFKIIPSLAKTWNNPDNLTCRFDLRDDVKFHNGYDFSAEDVKYSIDLIKNDENNTFHSLLTMIKEVEIIDDFIVDIITFEPYPILLNKLTNIYIISKKYHENNDEEIQVGTGAYRFSEYIENNHIKFERFDDYWKETPKFQYVTFKFIDDYEERLNMLINGEVDMIDFVLPGSIDNLSEIEDIKTITFLQSVVTYLSFDFRENNSCCFIGEKNPLSDVRVRKAVYHVINISEIIEYAFSGYAEPASQFVTPYIFGYNPKIERLSFNLEKAQQYMKDAGYEKGFDVVLDTTTVGANRVNVSKTIANQLLKINISVKLNILSSGDLYNKIISKNSSFYLIGWGVESGDAGEIFDNILRSVDIDKGYGLLNFGNYSNPEIDNIAIDIYYNMNPIERLYLMQEGFSVAMDDVACIPLYVYYGISAMIDEISWLPRADGLIKLEDIKINS